MPSAKTIQPSPRCLAARRNGALGGKARAKKYSVKQRREWSGKGGTTTAERYGSEFARHRSTCRKKVGRHAIPVEQTKLAKRKKKEKIESRLKKAA
jgi:hypothetical protein